jgi:hypothetical protein
MLVLLVATSFAKVRILTGVWPEPMDSGFLLIFMLGAAIGTWTQREWYHKLLAPLAAIGLVAYIFVLFAHLR